MLLYHRVADGQDIHDLAVPAATFADQLTWLAANCCVMPLEVLLNAPHHDLPERAVAITFDDGYLDTLQGDAPILERAGLAATVFATTRWLDEPGEYWWDVLERALLLNERRRCSPSTPAMVHCRIRVERRTSVTLRMTRCTDVSFMPLFEIRDRLMAQIASWAGVVPDPHRRPMVADELQQLARIPGISIGAHSVNHLALPDQSAAVQEHEMEASARALERVVGHPVHSFAFPYGAVDRRSAEVSRRHYRWSMACNPTPMPAWFDTARVPRFEVKRWDKDAFADRIERMFAVRRRLTP